MLNFNRVGFSQTKGRRWLSLTIMPLVAGGFLGMTIPRGQALAGNPYKTCAEEMLEIGISNEVAANVCAGALQPKNLSRCVSNIYDNATEGVDPSFILFNCQRVRRPEELGICVADILDEIPEANSQIAIESCGRSLLPERYADCAIGLYEELQLPSTQIFASCLNPEKLDN